MKKCQLENELLTIEFAQQLSFNGAMC